ncbi:2-phosphosulfolactate phosphatase [Methanobrevibacter curvatus]|uniref:2-phosphosulfolactate phosphatase n=1 Tax=Methanobrevibacter curvatus TaxID=49547 RepID=A0A166CU74_9EURY|nr:2-phosphosulfolactate phosphatase [Methanobrevibacter curvatus]KZX14868.1 putative 2-phosphosulfolactate phosphatase [Methanobrevibacter curvatus]
MKDIKITLSLEKTKSKDVSIMVDSLRASTTITVALDNYEKIIPAFSKEEAIQIALKNDAILAGERTGEKINGFSLGNSPIAINKFKTDKKILVLTTSNGTRILESMDSKVLIGSLINSYSTALSALKIANNHVDIVMAGVGGKFAIEDYLVSGDIINSLKEIVYGKDQEINKQKIKINNEETNLLIDDYGEIASEESEDFNYLRESILNCESAIRLKSIGYEKDVLFAINKNISNNVGIYKNNEIKLFKDKN